MGHKQANANPSAELAKRFKEERAEWTAWFSTRGRPGVWGTETPLGCFGELFGNSWMFVEKESEPEM